MQRIIAPDVGAPMAPCQPSEEARRLLALRRSASAKAMREPGPDPATLTAMLEMAARVPDHRRLVPFRFIVVAGEARARAGDLLARALKAAEPSSTDEQLALERSRFLRAPLIVIVVARLTHGHKTPEWEQILTNGAVAQNLLLAASAHGFGANWITEWCAYDPTVAAGFGLAAQERITGFVYIGTAREDPLERPRPEMSEIVTEW